MIMSSRATAKFVPTTSCKGKPLPQSMDLHFVDILMSYNMRASDSFPTHMYKEYGHVNTKIARCQDLGILASGQCRQHDEDGEIVTILLFKALDKDHECYRESF